MKKLNQKGFTGFEVALLVLVVALLGFAGYVVYQRNKDPASSNQTVVTTESDEKKDSKSEEGKIEIPSGWIEYRDATTKLSFYYPKELTGTFTVKHFALSEYINYGYGAARFVAYSQAEDTWQEYRLDEQMNKFRTNNTPQTTTNRVDGKATIFITAGDGGSWQNSILFPNGEKLYRIQFPSLTGEGGGGDSDAAGKQDTLQKSSIEKLITTIKFNQGL